MDVSVIFMGLKKILTGIGFLITSVSVVADGGVGLGATRMVYHTEDKMASMPVINSTSNQHYLINSWVEDSNEVKTKDLIVTPPLYLSEPNTENALRVIKVLDNFHNDREKLYYLNVKSIPSSKDEVDGDKNILQFAILSKIKIFVRPPGLERIGELEEKLTFKVMNNDAVIANPTPYYMNMVNVFLDDKKVDSIMLQPFGQKTMDKGTKKIKFQLVNDYGALSKVKEVIHNN